MSNERGRGFLSKNSGNIASFCIQCTIGVSYSDLNRNSIFYFRKYILHFYPTDPCKAPIHRSLDPIGPKIRLFCPKKQREGPGASRSPGPLIKPHAGHALTQSHRRARRGHHKHGSIGT